MRDTMSEEMRQEMESAVESVESDFSPEALEAEHFMEEFKPARVTAAKLADLKAKYSGLTIAGVEDKKGYDLVHAGRMEVKGLRVAVDKVRKGLNEDHQEYIRKVNAEAKRITAQLVEIEKPLEEEENRIDAERERIKAEKQREADARLQRRVDALNAVGAPVNVGDLVIMDDRTFDSMLQANTEAFQAREKLRLDAEAALAAKQEAERLEAEKKAQAEAEAKAAAEAAEKERLAKVKAEQDAEAARLAAEREALRKEQEAFQAAKRAQEQAAREEQIRKEAEAKAKADAERRAEEERLAQERAALKAEQDRAAAEEARKAREAAKPDAEKLLALAATLRGTAFPVLATEAGKLVVAELQAGMTRYCLAVEARAKTLADVTVTA